MTLPSVVDLIAKEDDHSVAESRWGLMMWLLNIDKDSLSKIRTSADSKYIRVVNLTLQFLSSVRKIWAELMLEEYPYGDLLQYFIYQSNRTQSCQLIQLNQTQFVAQKRSLKTAPTLQ